jgi:hypothetical protein
MKNSIKRFEQLFEGLELDDDLFNDIIQDLEDELNADINWRKGYFNEESKDMQWLNDKPISSEDKLAYLVLIDISKLGFNKITRNLGYLYNDDRFFELFNQIRLISKRCKTYVEILNSSTIRLLILSDEKLELEEDPELYRLFTQVRDRFDKLKSDFGYSTLVKFEDNKISIKTDVSEYTDRKLNLALRGLEILPKFKMTKRTEGEGIRGEVFNIIEKK